MSDQNNKFARRYDREFKENAVALVLGGRSQSEVSRDLGVSSWSLGEWVKKARNGHAHGQAKTIDVESPEPFRQAQGPEPAEGQRELRRLRQDNDYLRQQRDILKKALGILSAEVPANVSR